MLRRSPTPCPRTPQRAYVASIAPPDAHGGLKAAVAAVLLGAAWQRCRVHFLRNVLARIPRGRAKIVLALVRRLRSQVDPAAVREQLEEVVARWP